MMIKKRGVRLVLLAGLACSAQALQGADREKPAAAPVGDAADLFGQREGISGAALSPDGSRLLYLSADRTIGTAVMVALSDGSAAPSVVFSANGAPLKIEWCDWADANRIVCNLYGAGNATGELLGYSRLIAVDADGKNPCRCRSAARLIARRVSASMTAM